MKQTGTAIWVLYKSFFNAVPGQSVLFCIGLAVVFLGYQQNDSQKGLLLTLAGVAFLVGFPLSFAGPHFRQLASLKKHQVLPRFKEILISSYFAVLFSLAALLFFSYLLICTNPSVVTPPIPHTVVALSCLSVIAITSLTGFLTHYFRFGFWLMLIGGVTQKEWLIQQHVTHLLFALIGIALCGVLYFIIRMIRSDSLQFYTKKPLSFSKYTPGLSGNFSQTGVTALGSVLLGMSDGHSSRMARAFFTGCVIPNLLFVVVLGIGHASNAQAFSDPKLLLIALTTAFALSIHHTFSAHKNKRFIWLRVDGNKQTINQLILGVLAKERWSTALCVLMWAIPVSVIYPPAMGWLLGLCILLWFTLLLIEQLIFLFDKHLTHEFKFYSLIGLLGLLVGIIASAHVSQEFNNLWWGSATFATLVGLLRLKGLLFNKK